MFYTEAVKALRKELTLAYQERRLHVALVEKDNAKIDALERAVEMLEKVDAGEIEIPKIQVN